MWVRVRVCLGLALDFSVRNRISVRVSFRVVPRCKVRIWLGLALSLALDEG